MSNHYKELSYILLFSIIGILLLSLLTSNNRSNITALDEGNVECINEKDDYIQSSEDSLRSIRRALDNANDQVNPPSYTQLINAYNEIYPISDQSFNNPDCY